MLTTEQRATLKTAIQADATLNQLYVDGNIGGLADGVNANAVPNFFVWRTSVPVDEIMSNGFDWTRVDNMTAGEARIWEFMTQLGFINPSRANVRAGINEAFKGTVQDDALRLAAYGHCQRLASFAEKLFATGAGTTSNNAGVGPGTMAFVGPVTINELFGL